MKDSKVLPFGEWFKIYERADYDFNKTQAILESTSSLKYFGKLFEESLPQVGLEIPSELTAEKGHGIGSSLKAYLDGMGDALPINMEENNAIYEKSIKLSKLIPNLSGFFSSGPKFVNKSVDYQQYVFMLVIAGIGQATGRKELATDLIKDMKLLDSLGMSVEYSSSFDVPAVGGKVLLDTKLNNDGSFDYKNDYPKGYGKNKSEVCAYLNTVNLINWGIGNFNQYFKLVGEKYSKSSSDVSVFDLREPFPAPEDFAKVESDVLYLFTDSLEEVGDKSNTATPNTAASPGKGVWLSYATDNYIDGEDGSSVTDHQVNPDFKELASQIMKELGETDVITKMTLNWTGSTLWKGKKITGSGTGANEPLKADKTKLDGGTYMNDATALGGQWLNWFRATDIAEELAKILGARLQGGVKAIDVTWQLKDLDSAKDSNVTYSIVSKTPSAAQINDTAAFTSILKGQAQGSDKIETTKIYRYAITFELAAVASNVEGKLKKAIGIGKETYPYDRVAPGDSVKYKAMIDGKISDTETRTGTVISKDEAGITLKNSETGNRVTIKRERYITGEKVRKSDSKLGI